MMLALDLLQDYLSIDKYQFVVPAHFVISVYAMAFNALQAASADHYRAMQASLDRMKQDMQRMEQLIHLFHQEQRSAAWMHQASTSTNKEAKQVADITVQLFREGNALIARARHVSSFVLNTYR